MIRRAFLTGTLPALTGAKAPAHIDTVTLKLVLGDKAAELYHRWRKDGFRITDTFLIYDDLMDGSSVVYIRVCRLKLSVPVAVMKFPKEETVAASNAASLLRGEIIDIQEREKNG